MSVEIKKGCKTWCASCKKQIHRGVAFAISSTRTGQLSIHHLRCENEYTTN